MATAATAPRTYDPQDPTGMVAQLSQWLAGTQTKTAGGATTTTSGDTGPLNAVLAQLMDPNNLQALVGQLFNQAALQVPSLTAQFANATGSRVAGNTPLASSLAMLNTNLAQAIAQSVVQQQQTAATAAGKLAEVNKTTNTSENKTATTQPASLTKALLPTLAGFALNKADKAGLLGGKTPAPAAAAATPIDAVPAVSAAAGTPDYVAPYNAPVAFSAPVSTGISSTDLGATSLDSGAPGTGLDTGVAPADVPSATTPDVGSTDITGDTDIGSMFSEFLADGGTVRRPVILIGKPPVAVQGKGWAGDATDAGEVRSYADGGEVSQVRNVPNFGAAPVVTPSGAINVDPNLFVGGGGIGGQGIPVIPGTAIPMTANMIAQMILGPTGLPNSDTAGGGPGTGVGAGPTGTSSTGDPTGGTGLATSLSGLSPGLVAGIPVGGIVNALVQAITTSTANNPASAMPGVTQGVTGITDEGVPASPDTGGIGPGVTTGITGITDEGIPASDSTSTSTTSSTDSGTSTANAGTPGGDSGDGASLADGGTVNDDGDEDDKNLPVKGLIKGKGTRSSDSINIKASVDEYMLPASVVDYIGKDVLDDLVASIHTPTRTGTHG